jgi:hypothetical protein
MFRSLALDNDRQYLAWAFCCAEHCDCARYKQTLAGEAVPPEMLPTGVMWERKTSKVDSK